MSVLLLSCLLSCVAAEGFTALATMTKALYNEKELAHEMRKYVDIETERLAQVRRYKPYHNLSDQ